MSHIYVSNRDNNITTGLEADKWCLMVDLFEMGEYLGWADAFSIYQAIIPMDTNDYYDVLTFGSAEATGFTNCKIGEFVNYVDYGVAFPSRVNNITIPPNPITAVIGGDGLTIGNNSFNMIIGQGFANLTIGTDCSEFIIGAQQTGKIGNGCTYLCIADQGELDIGNNVYEMMISKAFKSRIGDGCDIGIIGGSVLNSDFGASQTNFVNIGSCNGLKCTDFALSGVDALDSNQLLYSAFPAQRNVFQTPDGTKKLRYFNDKGDMMVVPVLATDDSMSEVFNKIQFLNKFNHTYETTYTEFTYTGKQLTGIGIWNDYTKSVPLYTAVLAYTGKQLTTMTITDEITTGTLVKTFTYTGKQLTKKTLSFNP